MSAPNQFHPERFILGHLAAWLMLLLVLGCENSASPPIVAAAPATQTAQLSQVRAAVDQAKTDNTRNPSGPARQAVDLQLRVAQSGLPESKVEDRTAPAELSALVFEGKLQAALDRALTAEQQLAALKEQAAADRAFAAEQLRQHLAKAAAQVAEAESAAQREAYLAVVKVFAIIGGACAVVGLGMIVWTTFKRIGATLLAAGPIIGGSGLLWGKPWFYLTIGLAVILGGIALGIWWAVAVYENRRSQS